MPNFIEIIHTNSTITTLAQFIKENTINMTPNELLNYEDNKNSVLNSYLSEDGVEAKIDLLRIPTKLKVPLEKIIMKEVVFAENNIIFPNNKFDAFLSDRIEKILTDTNYKPLQNNETELLNPQLGKTFRAYENVTVFIWCKALGDKVGSGRLIDVTPFIQNITINSGGNNGGNFSMNLAPLSAEFGANGQWAIKSSAITKYAFNGKENYVSRDSVIKQVGDINEKKKFLHNSYFFHNIIQSNDVVFIQFESLEMEKNKRERDKQRDVLEGMVISEKEITGRIWDMIGLVDDNSKTFQPPTDVNIQIGGRDMMKLLLEDGSYVYPGDFARTEDSLYANIGGRNKSLKDNPTARILGEFNFFSSFVDRTIEFSLKFIFNLLSNIKICDESLHNFYEAKDLTIRREYIETTKSVENLPELKALPDETRKVVEELNKKRKTLKGTDTLAGIWGIIKLVLDKEVEKRRIVDSSISMEQGSLISFIRKVCQEPFVEFWGDTFGDQYFFIARKPPHDKSGFESLMKKGIIVDIEIDDVYSESLKFDDSEVYSWYRLVPRGNFAGDDGNISLEYFPAVFFKEYAEIWGSRPYDITTNYINFDGIRDVNGKVSLNSLVHQGTEDLQFIIETNAYKPFTRTGTIVIKGDRRIKRGFLVRYKPTGEIFYVDSVSNSASITSGSVDRVTVLNVSRGMVEKYMFNDKINYFNIVKQDARHPAKFLFKEPKLVAGGAYINEQAESSGKNETTISTFQVNPDVFDFFIKRKQLG